MLKRLFALSDQGSKDLNKGIAATTLSNICLIIPSSLLIMVIWELLNVISGESSGIIGICSCFLRYDGGFVYYCILYPMASI